MERICNNSNVLVWLIGQYCNSNDTELLKEAYRYYFECLAEKRGKYLNEDIYRYMNFKMRQFINIIITGDNKINRRKGVKNGQKLLFEAGLKTEKKYNKNDIVKLLCRHVQGALQELANWRAQERQDIYAFAAEAWQLQRNDANCNNALYSLKEEKQAPLHHDYFVLDENERQDREDGWPGEEEA